MSVQSQTHLTARDERRCRDGPANIPVHLL
jgi:hypothetical protein